MNEKKASISVVVPVYNEEENAPLLHRDILKVCTEQDYDFEIIFVDDGSTDKTVDALKSCTPLTLVRLRRNFGQTAALDAGIKAASKDYIITMDGDRQNDPADIPWLIKTLEESDLDVVSGWRKNRKDTFAKRFASRGANLLRKMIVHDGIHDSGCSLKIYKRECFEDINLYGEMHRFVPALLIIKGFRVGEMVVNHRPRTAGKTKYNWKRTFKGFLDMISVWFWNRFAVRPLHLLGSLGIVNTLLGFVFGIWSIVLFVSGADLSDHVHPVLTVAFMLAGVFLIICGLMSDMLCKVYFGTEIDRSYSVKEVIKK